MWQETNNRLYKKLHIRPSPLSRREKEILRLLLQPDMKNTVALVKTAIQLELVDQREKSFCRFRIFFFLCVQCILTAP